MREDSDTQAAYDRAKSFSAQGDVNALLALADEIPTRLSYNSDRNSLQLGSCDGSSIVSNLRVPDQLVATAALLK